MLIYPFSLIPQHSETNSVALLPAQETELEIVDQRVSLTEEELDLIAAVVYAEARGEPMDGKVAVVNVILNRLKSGDFPDTISEIIFQGSAFSPVRNGWREKYKPTQDCYDAIEQALVSEDNTNGALYFYNPKIAKDGWIRSRRILVTINNHTFAK